MTGNPQITFVCCVESGWVKDQTVRMIESLRRWGGQLANSLMLVVTPRFGSPLSYKTHQAFERLQVQYLRVPAKSKYSWFPYLNKPSSLVAAEEHTTRECVVWVDSDLLFVGEPEKFILNEGEDFVACASDKNTGTSDPEDLFKPYWNKICQVIGIDIEEKLKAARILHYHDSMWSSFWPEFIKILRTTHQPIADWLDSLGSMKNEVPLHWRITNQLLKKFRVRQESAYKEPCKVL